MIIVFDRLFADTASWPILFPDNARVNARVRARAKGTAANIRFEHCSSTRQALAQLIGTPQPT